MCAMSGGSIGSSPREPSPEHNVPPAREFPRQSSCCCTKPNNKIEPDGGSSQLVEIRKNRWLQICHYHPTIRDQQFQIEFETYLKYRKTGRDFTRKQQLLQLLQVKQRSRSNSIISNSSLLNSAVHKRKVTTDSMKTEWSGSGALPGSVVSSKPNFSEANGANAKPVSSTSSNDGVHVDNEQPMGIRHTSNNPQIKTDNTSSEMGQGDDALTKSRDSGGIGTLLSPINNWECSYSLKTQHSDDESIKTSRDIQLSVGKSEPRENQHSHDKEHDIAGHSETKKERESSGIGDNYNKVPHDIDDNCKLGTSTFRENINTGERPTSNDSTSTEGSEKFVDANKETINQGKGAIREDKGASNQGKDAANQDKSTTNQDKGADNHDKGEDSAVLFFFHGVGGSADVWQPQVDYFYREGYEIVVPDLLGHGFSQAPRTQSAYHFKELTKDIVAIFDKYCKRRNVIIGHSYGTCFTTVLARQRSLYVTKMILISGGGPTPLEPQPGIFSLPSCLLACLKPLLVCGFKKSAFVTKSKTYVPKEKAFDVPSYVLKHTMNGQDWKDGDENFHRWISVPTLLIYGINDPLVTLWETQVMQKTVFGSTLEVIKDASHMVMIDQPVVTNRLIHNFLHKNFRVIGTAKRQKTFTPRHSSALSLKTLPPSGLFMTPKHKDH